MVLLKPKMVRNGVGVRNNTKQKLYKMKNITENIKNQLEEAGYDYAVAVATESEIDAGAACGQLSIITEELVAEDQF